MRERLLSLNSCGLFVMTASLAMFVVPLCAGAAAHRFLEDFSSTDHCDALQTTGLWDTASGELKLWPFEITLVGSCNTPGTAYSVAIAGDYAYVTDGSSGLRAINISNPSNPTPAGSYATGGTAYDVAIAGDYAYVTDQVEGALVIDITDPSNPALAGSYEVSEVYGIAVSGDYGYGCYGTLIFEGGGLGVLDISIPSNPRVVGDYSMGERPYDVAIAGDYAYVADAGSGLRIINISNPSAPSLAGGYDTPGTARSVAIAGDYAYVADGSSGLQVINITSPSAPTQAGAYNTSGYAYGVAVAGDYAYVADGSSGLQVINITSPSTPTLTGGYNTSGNAYNVAVDGDYAYVADGTSGLQVIHISNPSRPILPGSCDTPGSAYGIGIDGDYAYVADGNTGLQVINISSSSSPAISGSYNTLGTAYGLAVAGDYAYVADGGSGLQVVNIASPSSPTLAGSYDTPGTAYGVAVDGDYVYVADGNSGLQVVSIYSPSSPTLAGSYNTVGTAYGVAVDGDYAYVADGSSGLQVVSIYSPPSPTLAGSYNTPGTARGVAIAGNYVYVADGSSGLQVISIYSPSSPTLAGSYDTPGAAYSVAIAGNYAYVADDLSGLQVINIANPSSPTLAGSYDTPGSARGISVDGDCAYMTDWGSGLQVLQVCQRLVDVENNRGQSLVLNSLHENIVKTKLSTIQSDSIRWEVSGNNGASWQGMLPDGQWHSVVIPGGDLIWRSTHSYTQYMVNPTCTQLDIEWLYNCPLVDSIVDVPGDEGGLVRIHFARSGFDFPGESTYPITSYKIYRRVDGVGLVAEKLSVGLPPGTWGVVDSVSATQQEQYTCVVPSLADSVSVPVYSVYCVGAETASPPVYFYSPPDSGYSVDNLAPGTPIGLAGDYGYPPPQLLISWQPNHEADLSHYAVYKGDNEGFIPGESNRLGTTADTFLVDDEFDVGVDNYYKVSAWDIHGNESSYSLLRPDEVTDVSGPPAVPTVTLLEQNVPNPFNPVTVIRFSIAEPGRVTLAVYDVAGRPVRKLVEGKKESGFYSEIWDGRTDDGTALPSGVYICRLEASDFMATRKLVLLR